MFFDQSFASASIGVAIGMNSVLLARDLTERDRKITLALLTLPATTAIALGLMLGNNIVWLAACFVAIIFTAVLARKFGPRGNALGLIAFSSYVLSIFFHESISVIPWITATIFVSITIAWLVRFVIFPKNHKLRIFWAKRAFLARASIVLRILIDITDDSHQVDPHPTDDALNKRRNKERKNLWAVVNQNLESLNDTMLLIETILVDDLQFHFADTHEASQPNYVSQQTEWFLAVETLCARTVTTILKILAKQANLQKRRAIREALVAVRASLPLTASPRSASETTETLQYIVNAQPNDYDIRRLTVLLRDLQKYADQIPLHELAVNNPNHKAADLNNEGQDTFPSHARTPTTIAWYRDVFFQTAMQAAVAAALSAAAGYWLAPTRWHWAVIASFVIFVQTKTRGDTLIKAWNRFIGTVLGIAAGLLLAKFLQDHLTVEIIGLFICIFLGYYFVRVSYVWLIAFLTTEIALLYGILGKASPDILFVRIEETILGLIIGTLVAVFFLPAKTRPHIKNQISDILRQLSAFYEDITRRFEKNAPVYASTKSAFQLSRSLQNLRLLASPLNSNFASSGFITIKYQIVLISILIYYSRNLAMIASFADYDPQTRKLIHMAAVDLAYNFDCLATAIIDPNQNPVMRSDPERITSVNAAISRYQNMAADPNPEHQPTLSMRSCAILLTLRSSEDVAYQIADEISKFRNIPD